MRVFGYFFKREYKVPFPHYNVHKHELGNLKLKAIKVHENKREKKKKLKGSSCKEKKHNWHDGSFLYSPIEKLHVQSHGVITSWT